MARHKRPQRRSKTKAKVTAKTKAKASATRTRKRAKPTRRPAKAAHRKTVRRKAKPVTRRRAAAVPRAKVRGSRPKPKPKAATPGLRSAKRGSAKRASKPRPGSVQARPKPATVPRVPRPQALSRPPLNRERRVLSDDERLELAAASSSSLQPRGAEDRLTSSAHAGHDELRAELRLHTETSPILTAGDVDAKWQDAYAVGDEAPGGDNPTPDQDRVDDIGKALGIEYEDGQELQGGDEVLERDRHRWEFDPASSEDWTGERKK